MATVLRVSKMNGFRKIVSSNFRKFSAKAESSHEPGVHEAGERMWRNLTFYLAGPCVFMAAVHTYLVETEHHKHFHRPEYIEYEYMRIRNKPFPFRDGNRTLFHHPKYNALPGGYEDELEEKASS